MMHELLSPSLLPLSSPLFPSHFQFSYPLPCPPLPSPPIFNSPIPSPPLPFSILLSPPLPSPPLPSPPLPSSSFSYLFPSPGRTSVVVPVVCCVYCQYGTQCGWDLSMATLWFTVLGASSPLFSSGHMVCAMVVWEGLVFCT